MKLQTDVQRDEVYLKVQSYLKRQLKSDEAFKEELQNIYYFYERKLLKYADRTAIKDFIAKEFEDVVHSQYFQGYYIMKSLITSEELELSEDVWSMKKGHVRNYVPQFLKTAFEKESIDWTYTNVSHQFGMELLHINDSMYHVFKQIRHDLASYGAYKAFIEDDRYVANNEDKENDLYLGNPFDLEFLNPQIYMLAQFSTNEHEIWDMHAWSSFRDGMWLGSVHFSTLPMGQEGENTLYLLELSLSNTISQEEKLDIVNVLVNRLSKDVKSVLQTRLYYVEDFDVIIAKS